MNTQKQSKISFIIPVLFAFFIMSFVDLVGIGVDKVKNDFNLSSTMAQFIPMVAFVWFLVFSVPTGVLQAKLGKKNVLNLGMLLTALGLFIPIIHYSFATVLVGFAFLGIGNTIVQVSANPLLVMVVPENRSSSFLSFSQFVKAVGSMVGAPLAALFAARFGDWKILFTVFGIVSVLAVLWLGLTPISEEKTKSSDVTIASAFKLLSNSFILIMVLGIFLVVGVDVGFNSFSGQFLMNKLGLDQTVAETGRSVYFFGRMVGTFTGALLLTRVDARKFLLFTSVLSILVLILIVFTTTQFQALFVSFLIGLAVANVFPLIFSIAVKNYPDNANEISGLMMMAVSGGAVIPFIMGIVSDNFNEVAAIMVLVLCMFVILLSSFRKANS